MANDNAVLEASENDSEDYLDFDELEAKLESDLDSELSELGLLKEDREKIGNPESLGTMIKDVVWEQFLNQMAVTAGEDFIRENRGLTLDLRNSAHIQTTENFENGKIATHNDKIDFQKRYDGYQDNFQKNDDGTVKTKYDNRSNSYQKVLEKGYREPFDKNRDKGTAAVQKDHTVSAAEILRDPAANAHLEKQEHIKFANSNINLNDMDASANMSKKDSAMSDWLDSERDGKKPAERFNIDEKKLREEDRLAREEYEKIKEEGERKSTETGRQSQREEAFRIGGKALRAALMQLLAELIKAVIGKLILWFKSAKKNLETLIDSIKSGISSFISKLKTHLVNAGSAIITTVATAIFGPIIRVIRSVWTMLKQGWRSVKEAIAYLKNPDNKNKPFGRKILEIGKIVIAGLSAVGAIVLGQVIEKGLMAIPVFAIEIPILGSLASLVGLFLGGLVAGIIGAIAINLINKLIARQQMGEALGKEIVKGNEVLSKQNTIIALNEKKLENTKIRVANSISERHKAAAEMTKDAIDTIFSEDTERTVSSGNEDAFNNMLDNLSKLSK